jgi:WD40 repeat protein
VAISRDGSIGITGSDDGMLRVWNLADGSERIAHKFDSAISTIALSPDDALVFVGRRHGAGMIWDVQSGAPLGEIGHDRSSIVSARFSADNTRLLTGFPTGRIILWDVGNARALRQWTAAKPVLRGPSGLVATDVAFGSRENTVLNGFSDGSIMVWQGD